MKRLRTVTYFLFVVGLSLLWRNPPVLAAEHPQATHEHPQAVKKHPTAVQTQPAKPTLYQRLGGVYSIATVVDDFIERLLVNDILNANPKIKEARDRVPKAGLKYQVTALVCQVTGGPQQYTGRSMKEAHAHLNITEREWQAMTADFKRSLDKLQVPEPEQRELFAIVESTKPDIVLSSTAQPRK
ncbi:MAG: group 1 truncated hemoglobin [Elusimicrobia bacterium]|nr:group 1 truncated hemoglobin [Elusimicrobiota bacterium]